jgi:hypothetical protein
MTPVIIAFCGRAGHGKSTAAAHLVSRGAVRCGFADRLKELACRVWRLDPSDVNTQEGKLGTVRTTLYRERGTPTAAMIRQEQSVRGILQTLGNEAREVLGEGVWVGALMTWIQRDATARAARGERVPAYVIDDLRYPNEAKAVRGYGGVVIRLRRPDAPVIADPAHPSETAVDECAVDMEIVATTVTELLAGVEVALDGLRLDS